MQSGLARVLIVDDNEDLRHLIALKIQKKPNAQASQADSAAAARGALSREHFDVIIYSHSDWAQGVELYNELSLNRSHPLQFLMFMSDPSRMPQDIKRAILVIRKPDFDDLMSTIVWPSSAN